MIAPLNFKDFDYPAMLDGLPKSAGGKIAKNKLTEFITARLKEEAERPAR